jgi:response regulator RpfG family c-di-GMP phosphodiesterase
MNEIPLELVQTVDDFIESWVQCLELRDGEAVGHAHRVTKVTTALARKVGIDLSNDIMSIQRGSMLHDIGKIAMPDRILFKPGSLSTDEWVVMRRHPEYAYGLLFRIRYLRDALIIPFCHHERWDGTGYPRKLQGSEIPLAARLFTVVDVWDALKSERCYRPAWNEFEARKYLYDKSGSQFDPDVVNMFFEYLDSDIRYLS